MTVWSSPPTGRGGGSGRGVAGGGPGGTAAARLDGDHLLTLLTDVAAPGSVPAGFGYPVFAVVVGGSAWAIGAGGFGGSTESVGCCGVRGVVCRIGNGRGAGGCWVGAYGDTSAGPALPVLAGRVGMSLAGAGARRGGADERAKPSS